jgi:hypothetical protein
MCTSNSKTSRRAFSVCTTLTLIVAGCIPLSAQSGGNFQITNSVIAAGGGESKDVVNNRLGHQSTVGEHATGTLLQNPPYSQTAGFWASQIDLSPTASAASISGRILTSDGVPLAGATINLGGARTAQAITDGNGAYTFADLEVGGFYTVTPARANYSFNPSSRSFSLVGTMTDAVFTATASGGTLNPLDITAFLVRQHYLDFLGREPDPVGLAFWTNEITSCGTDPACIQLKRVNVSAAFFLSIEFQQTGYLVERLYKTAYGSSSGASTLGGTHKFPVPNISLHEFLRDTQQIGQGVIVLKAGWETALENNKQAFTTDFVQQSRFNTAFPASLTAAQFVDALNANADSPLSVAERLQLSNGLLRDAQTRAQVLRTIAAPDNLNPQLLHARAQRAGWKPQDFGGPIRPFDLPARSFAHGGDVLSLHLFQSLARLVRQRGRQRLRGVRDL